MADLGPVPTFDNQSFRPTLIPITDYNVSRGRFLGAVVVIDNQIYQPPRLTMTGYVVRQIRLLYRQIWPPRGQRFPQ